MMHLSLGALAQRPYPARLVGNTTTTPTAVTFRSGSYTADIHNYSTSEAAVFQTLDYNPATFPSGSLLKFQWPHDGGLPQNFTVRGYNQNAAFGDYAGTVPNTPITASTLANINTFTVTFYVTTDPNNFNNFDGIIDYFFWSGSTTGSTLECEVEIAYHPALALTNFADFLAAGGSSGAKLLPYPATISGISWNCSYSAIGGGHGPDIYCYPVSKTDITGYVTLDIKAFHSFFLQNTSVVTVLNSGLFFTGIGFGSEPFSDSGYVEFHNLSYNYVVGGTINLLISPNFLGDWMWTATNVTVTNAGLPNMALMETTATGNHNVEQAVTVAGSAHTFQFQADVTDPATSGLSDVFVSLKIFDSAYANVGYAYWNMTTHALGGDFAGSATFTISGTPSITSLGSGVYRCVVVVISTGATTTLRCRVAVEATADTESYLGVTGHGLQVTNVQLTQIA